MKTATFFQAALVLGAAAVMATSCNKEEKANVLTDDGLKSVVLKIDLGQSGTKAMTPSDSWQTIQDVNVDNIAIYFTDKNNIIRYAFKADATSEGNAADTVWNNFKSGVRFIGMEGISKVYAIANDPEISGVSFDGRGYYTGSSVNINSLNIDIEKCGTNLKQTSVPYVGGANEISPVNGTVAENDDNEVIVNRDGEGGPYFSADITIRPVLSRFEINQVSIQTNGTLYFKEDAETGVLKKCESTDPEAMYKFDYSGFDAVLTGIYMSNFFRDAKLIPVPSELSGWKVFTNEGGTQPIIKGDWNGLEDEYQDIARYTGWNGSNYEALLSEATSTTGNIKYLFDGSDDGKVIPFHFLYPYDITDNTATNPVESPVETTPDPQLSFQFIPVENENITISNCQYWDGDSWEAITDQSIITMLQGEVYWPHTVGQTNDQEVYANVTSFLKENSTALKFSTGMIYRVQNVLVTPDALATTTKSTDASNIIVEVSIVPFAEENVYPVFE